MKDENEFNSKISKALKPLETRENFTFAVKAADKFRSGVSDFMIYRGGRATALENKFLRKWPSDRSKLLSHPFSGPQITYLESLKLAGCGAYGMIGVEEEKAMFLIPQTHIPENGNWKTGEFKSRAFQRIDWLDVDSLLEELFNGW